jgi:hypothetical protein
MKRLSAALVAAALTISVSGCAGAGSLTSSGGDTVSIAMVSNAQMTAIAMSRSLDGTPTMSLPPISMLPSSMSSSPASIRSAVLLPDPDGPTSTTNSPSEMSRLRESTASLSEPS